MAADRIAIGYVRAVTPGKRLLRIAPARGRERDLRAADWLRVDLREPAPDGRHTIRCRVERATEDQGQFLVTVMAGVPRDTVALMKGGEIWVDKSELLRPESGYEPADLMGLRVVAASGAVLGTVVELYFGAQVVAEIEKEDGGLIRVPLIEQVVAAVELDSGVMRVHDIAPYAVEDVADAD